MLVGPLLQEPVVPDTGAFCDGAVGETTGSATFAGFAACAEAASSALGTSNAPKASINMRNLDITMISFVSSGARA